ncbi:glucose-6-phosphate 1-dehydrogenase X [Sphaeroforma arctica JP610]|uniref:Glucose-6-phosphate 1-dehydrogenase n=1 Tax=Sphaeroforma arctica JP610 TaxID=667725 RepID=A0A0L0FGW4_9EUKA|nr:glucose-6-phosphate 1-dehydrogenase X [Sphaeroforma arctica JP610]KNC76019.1 glucose-6-phosphate 1-dehydrogenase X [Sphaeroforma arctica JP610]|eukprot:XP_014149921.1 glucose-6-phosphate 1-dehydrogenase X [Sphaeroforma arctica JP610]
MDSPLTIVVFGASGDLAAKKTYPTLFSLFVHNFLPQHTQIVGYARSKLSKDELIKKITPYIKPKNEAEKETMKKFFELLSYVAGAYDDGAAFKNLNDELVKWEDNFESAANRMHYLALPPSVFQPVTTHIKAEVMASEESQKWTRVIIEKPFGKDSVSSAVLSNHLASLFTEEQIYRIDHYLGKEMVQNLLIMRFANAMFQPIWNRNYIECVRVTFKEPFGTQGRGGYFDEFGIIRDILQNHLLQVLCIVAMEKPASLDADDLRNEKVKVLKAIKGLSMDDTVLGQYVASNIPNDEDSKLGYLDDKTVPDDSKTPTYASTVLYVENERWDGVPFIMKAGKALDERKADIRIQFKDAPGDIFSALGGEVHRNELVIRLQPDEAVYMKLNIKSPGLRSRPLQAELDVTYKDRFEDERLPDAYERLLLDVIRGQQGHFVRSDELAEAWRIFTPLLHDIDAGLVESHDYAYGSRGPSLGDDLAKKFGYKYHKGAYIYSKQPPQ